jgi:hypothetical protein
MRTLASFKNEHSGSTIIVCGCGESLNELSQPDNFLTIGVNDVGRLFQPNYLVVLNPRNQFSGDRFRYVESSRAEYLFTQLDLGIPHPNIVKFRLGAYAGTDFSNPDTLSYTQNSPYVALCLAIHMGAKQIGLIGVDFTNNHFFAKTGTHPLNGQFATIDGQYRKLAEAVRARGIEIVNLSSISRLRAFPKRRAQDFAAICQRSMAATTQANAPVEPVPAHAAVDTSCLPGEPQYSLPERTSRLANPHPPKVGGPRVFGVNYRFVSCGDVFSTGLQNAAAELGVTYESAMWDDPDLPAKLERFQPDLLFVVHGRRYVQKWGTTFRRYRSAVWLVDEPYEVDDTSQWSPAFQTVFVNDPSTISRHRNAHYLPVCFDAVMHCDKNLARNLGAGFIGGYNETRERYLNAMAEAGLLTYVVGGPWKSPLLRRLSLGMNVPPARTTDLYQQTRVVVNVFRHTHHFNRGRIQPRSMNPRIYEALACGALVVSEPRPEISEVFPSLPTFDSPDSVVGTLGRFLTDEPSRKDLVEENRKRLAGNSYSDRLKRILELSLGTSCNSALVSIKKKESNMNSAIQTADLATRAEEQQVGIIGRSELEGWLSVGDSARPGPGGEVCLEKLFSNAPGSETGLASALSYNDVELSFSVKLESDTWFIAKIHQLDQLDQKANSYHIVSEPAGSYLAKHHRILGRLPIARGVWQPIVFRRVDMLIEVSVNGFTALRVPENHLQNGYCFIGVKGGRAELKEIRLRDLSQPPRKSAARLGRRSETRTGTAPFTSMPKRNLIYHIWPVLGSNWAWNLDQLKRRVDIFNGRRILGIVHDDRSEPPERVQKYVEGHGFEFVIAKNDQRGEAITFPIMMERVASDDPNEITFYAHAKGVKYGANTPPTVRRWAEVLYRVALDDWLTVKDQMSRYAITGLFRMLGRFKAHRSLADWHYSGTFFWMRHSAVFSRNYQNVPQFYGGVETWPGMTFQREETGCLFLDNLRELPYHQQFWRNTAEPALQQWQSGVRASAPPPDLIRPLPYKDYSSPRMEQRPEEFDWWVNRLFERNVSRILTIGSREGGVEWHLAREAAERHHKIEITAIEKAPDPKLIRNFEDARQQFEQSLKLIQADSTSPSTREQLADRYDAVFIDGDHGYRACRSDFALAESLRPALIGLHDIVDSDWHVCAHCCVSRLWAELSKKYRTEENISAEWGGIGVVFAE